MTHSTPSGMEVNYTTNPLDTVGHNSCVRKTVILLLFEESLGAQSLHTRIIERNTRERVSGEQPSAWRSLQHFLKM